MWPTSLTKVLQSLQGQSTYFDCFTRVFETDKEIECFIFVGSYTYKLSLAHIWLILYDRYIARKTN